MSSLGSRLLASEKRLIELYGEPVTVSRRATTQGGMVSSQTLTCFARPIRAEDDVSLKLEGISNLSAAMPHLFRFAGAADVQEATDEVAYQGYIYQIVQVTVRRVDSVTICTFATGIRDR